MSKDVVAFCMQISINVKARTEKSAKRNRGLFLLETKKGTSKAKKEQAIKKGTSIKGIGTLQRRSG